MGEFVVAKTSVWWDIENCCVPRGCDPQLIVHNMSSALATAGYRGPISVSAYGDTHLIRHSVQHALSSTGVSLNHVPAEAGTKDASDKKILVDMLCWAIDNPPPANYLLISGDRDFSNAIHKLKMRRYNILLAQPPNVSQTLTAAANSVWLWKSLVAGEPPLAQSPYISSTSSGNKVDLDKSKSIVSSSSHLTKDTNPEVQNLLSDLQTGANGNADKKYEAKQPSEMQTDNVSKPASEKQKRSSPGGSVVTMQTASKKSKGCNRRVEQSKFKQPRIGQVEPVLGQRLICNRCGEGHLTAEWHLSGKLGHKDRVCKENPISIVKWMPAHSQDLATSLPGSLHVTSYASHLHPACSSLSECSKQVTPGVLSLSPAPTMARAPPQTADEPPSASSHSGVCAMPTAVEVDREMAQPTTSAPCSPLAVPAYRPSQGQDMICFKCGVVGHCSAECSYIGSCLCCGQLGHMERVCKGNPDSIIKWEQVHAYVLATSSQGSMHMNAPTSQLYQTWTPPPGCFFQAAPAVPTPSPTPAAPASPHTGVAATSTPAQPGISATATGVSLGIQEVVLQPTSSALPKQTASKKSKSKRTLRKEKKSRRKRLRCFRCGDRHPAAKCTFSGDCQFCGKPGHKDRVCTANPKRILRWIPAYLPSHGQGMNCFKCGAVGHWAAQCSYVGACKHCGQLGHMECVCKENPDSIIKWEQLHA